MIMQKPVRLFPPTFHAELRLLWHGMVFNRRLLTPKLRKKKPYRAVNLLISLMIAIINYYYYYWALFNAII